ncbi:uncharacterized protein LOC128231739 [Mya arenaria]|uniref:uncharacterized protein LOC128231739 n=1 Tax=Mya arenaria TaxID=6604 RepID=UPI0022E5B379|nr:uncharacterized protein LOC128231739 [Mya arenaria]
MVALNGKWKLVYTDKVGEYSDAIGTKPEHKEQALRLLTPENDIFQEISISGDSVDIKVTVPGKVFEIRTKLGETSNVPFLDGRQLKSIFVLEGDKLVERQSGAFISTNTRYIDGIHLVLEMVAEDGTKSTRKYVKTH